MSAASENRQKPGAMFSGLSPELRPEAYVFCTTPSASPVGDRIGRAIAIFREDEGLTLVLRVEDAVEYGFDTSLPMARIVLNVFSALNGVGLTAAVAAALAEANIPCNVIAAYHHDHLFVPAHLGPQALALLVALQQQAEGEG
ncbi:ACT domain-containing protein [Paracoccus sp. S1E-3]|uniref:ACT domain-containing protein n=1 Tax=Paracoccus sp. S1E-3 TaxID=2756130 RepID=UPI0015EE5CFB|nr:ACT domain-containing protein [Paracoccus sp. S1E-3]MBA4489872.1 ACT domain-containing protein [Paracoccus sp. S1E-3]